MCVGLCMCVCIHWSAHTEQNCFTKILLSAFGFLDDIWHIATWYTAAYISFLPWWQIHSVHFWSAQADNTNLVHNTEHRTWLEGQGLEGSTFCLICIDNLIWFSFFFKWTVKNDFPWVYSWNLNEKLHDNFIDSKPYFLCWESPPRTVSTFNHFLTHSHVQNYYGRIATLRPKLNWNHVAMSFTVDCF